MRGMSENKSYIYKLLAVTFSAILISGLIQAAWIAKETALVSSSGGGQGFVFPFLMGVFSLLILLVFIVSIIGFFFDKTQKISNLALLFCLMYFVVAFIGGKISHKIWMEGFENLAIRSSPLVDAIKNYEHKYNQPPENLEALVQEFLPAIPKTGMGNYPDYQYEVNNPGRWHGNPWVLYVFTPPGGIGFDMFIYFPKQNYPEKGYGGVLERIKDWAYVHE